jgi:hypothetical protein
MRHRSKGTQTWDEHMKRYLVKLGLKLVRIGLKSHYMEKPDVNNGNEDNVLSTND